MSSAIGSTTSSSSTSSNAACFHCGLDVPAGSSWSVSIDKVAQTMCCPGCAAVAQTIVDHGLAAYYRDRSRFAEKPGAAVLPEGFALYDTPALAAQFESGAPAVCEATLSVEGLRCAACVWLIEKRLAHLPGLSAATLNVSTQKLQVRWDATRCKLSDILQALRALGYDAYPFDPIQHAALLRKDAKILFRQVFIAGLSMMQVMMYALPAYMAEPGSIDADLTALMRWASLFLTLPAVLYSAQPFFKGAWLNIRQRALGMDVPVAIGIGAAFTGSVWATVRGAGEVYFDSVTMFIFLLLCGRYLELVARRRAAGALELMQHALPASASLLSDFPASRDATLVPALQLRSRDIILVKPGEAIAADATIIEGETSVDLSLLTGESQPQKKRCGARLPGGAVNASQPILLRVEKPVSDSTLSALIRLIEQAGQTKPRIAQWADQVAAWFVAVLLLFALAVFGFWSWYDAARAWPVAIAVLVVSCPCALSLATPSALAAATDSLLRQGVLIVQSHVIETLHRATHIVFDKTGTLTSGALQLQQLRLLGKASRQQVLQLAAAMESSSAHPLARALIAAADADHAAYPSESRLGFTTVENFPGQGLQTQHDGVSVRLGSAVFVAQLAGGPVPADDVHGVTAIYLGNEAGWLARFDLADALRPDALSAITYFKAHGKKVVLLSGDRQLIAQQVADTLGMDEARGDVLPQQKLAFVQALQQQGAVVAMVGDGVNDAAVLRAADVSFAMGSGAALAQAHADTVLLTGRLSSLRDAARMAARSMHVIRQNLWWATLYNLLAIPAAALGLLSPWMAGVGMSASSALVVLNALRLAKMPAGPISPSRGPG